MGQSEKPKKVRRLKVFQAQLGFYDTVVAVASQAAALRVWGTHQDLFADGQARVAIDPDAIEAALAHPDMALRRAIGSADPFTLDPGLPRFPDVPSKRAEPRPMPLKAKPKPRPADRTKLDAAEAAIRALDEERRRETEVFRRRRAVLDTEEAAARSRWYKTEREAEQVLDRERQVFEAGRGDSS